MDAVQVFDGDGTRPDKWSVHDGVVLKSAKILISRTQLEIVPRVHPDDYIHMELGRGDHLRMEGLEPERIYLPRKDRVPLIIDVRSAYEFARFRGYYTWIVKAKAIALWRECPTWRGKDLLPELWFSQTDLMPGAT